MTHSADTYRSIYSFSVSAGTALKRSATWKMGAPSSCKHPLHRDQNSHAGALLSAHAQSGKANAMTLLPRIGDSRAPPAETTIYCFPLGAT